MVDLADGKRTAVEREDFIRICKLKAREGGFGTFKTAMKKGQQHTIRTEHLAQPHEECWDHLRWEIVGRVPEENDVEVAPREIKIGGDEAIDIELRLGVPGVKKLGGSKPLGAGCVLNDVGHVDAVAARGEVVDVGWRSSSEVEDAEGFSLLEIGPHLDPAAGVARRSLGRMRGGAALFFEHPKHLL